MLNFLDYTKINEYLLESLETSSTIGDFCRNYCDVLSQYLVINNLIIYEENINSIYQLKTFDNNIITYPVIIQDITNKYSFQALELADCHNNFADNFYGEYLGKNNINYLSLLNLSFQGKILGSIFLEIKNLKCLEKDVVKLLKIMNKYLAIYCYHKQLQKREEELTIATDKLIIAKEEQSKYLSHMNHELRTPIAAVIGFAKMLQQRMYGDLNVKQAQYIDAIYQSGTYLLELISDLLDISKIQAEKEELFCEEVLINELCESALALVKTKAQEQDLELKLVIDKHIKTCFIDQRRIKQILVNLLSNGVKFTEIGSVTLNVSQDDSYIFFKVIDTGIGIDKKSQQKLFQPFSQLNTHLHRHHRGTGLGLVISREFAKLHGGDIDLTSEKDKGSCFTLYIPRK